MGIDQRSVVMVYVVMGGPFVMNSEAEIARAFRDFRAGMFGPIPRQARLQYR